MYDQYDIIFSIETYISGSTADFRDSLSRRVLFLCLEEVDA
jgi:hypothetical protein